MRAAVVAVIRKEEHQRVGRLTGGVQRVEDLAQHGILHGAESPVMGDRLAHFVLAELIPELTAHALVEARLVVQGVAIAFGKVNVGGVIHVYELLGHVERVMRPHRTDKERPWVTGVLQVVDGPHGAAHHLVIV